MTWIVPQATTIVSEDVLSSLSDSASFSSVIDAVFESVPHCAVVVGAEFYLEDFKISTFIHFFLEQLRRVHAEGKTGGRHFIRVHRK